MNFFVKIFYFRIILLLFICYKKEFFALKFLKLALTISIENYFFIFSDTIFTISRLSFTKEEKNSLRVNFLIIKLWKKLSYFFGFVK